MIQMIDIDYDEFNEEFSSALKENIIKRWLYCYGILELNREKTLRRRLIVKYQKNAIELKLPQNKENLSFKQYWHITKFIIEEFQYKVDHLKKNKSLNTLSEFKGKLANFNANKIFEAINYYIKINEPGKYPTPIIYTGMTN